MIADFGPSIFAIGVGILVIAAGERRGRLALAGLSLSVLGLVVGLVSP